MNKNTKPKIEVKSVKHVFTDTEHREYGSTLAQSYGTLRGIESEFDKVKASFKSRTAEVEAQIDRISTNITNGFEYRDERCRVELDPKLGKKSYFLESAPEDAEPVIVQDMTDADYQQELLEAESAFDAKEIIPLFSATEKDSGLMTVGRLTGKWFSALNVKIGPREIKERLDSEQACSKKRADQIKRTCKRFIEWLDENLGRDEAQGFKNSVELVKAEHAEREE